MNLDADLFRRSLLKWSAPAFWGEGGGSRRSMAFVGRWRELPFFRFREGFFGVFFLVVAGCKESPVSEAASPDETGDGCLISTEERIPETLKEAVDRLDEIIREEDRQAFLEERVPLKMVYKQVGMQLRNRWGLWKGSKFKDYFIEREIRTPDLMSAVILNAWFDRSRTGSFDEARILAEYTEIERAMGEFEKNPERFTYDGGMDPFSQRNQGEGTAPGDGPGQESLPEAEEDSDGPEESNR